ncbi:hypothetical protein WJT86_10070 [Microvirga sp. W0021]|uniref:Terminase small subunit n=1 Tax=Hohaiivirga grylli TaxID=3133970 RepID=A0ABV0BMI9_9HYPH
MAKLKNQRHERFAQALAMDWGAEEAFRLAGYKEKGTAAEKRLSDLQNDQSILERIHEISSGVTQNNSVTIAMLTEGLLRIARECEASEAATAKNVARGAYMDIAKLNGFVKERVESKNTNRTITDKPLNDEEWAQKYATE